MMIRLLALAALAPAALLAACGGDDDEDVSGDDGGASTTAPAGDGEAETLEVLASDFEFADTELSAAAGSTVTVHLTNDGNAPHSFTIDGVVEVEADGGADATSESFVVPEGDVMFYCRYHPTQMQGTLTVDGDSAQNQGDTEPNAVGYSY